MMVTTKRLRFDKMQYMNPFHTTGTIVNRVYGRRLYQQQEQGKTPKKESDSCSPTIDSRQPDMVHEFSIYNL